MRWSLSRLFFLLVLLGLALPAAADPVEFVGADSIGLGGTTVTVQKPNGVQAGDVMIAQLAFRGTAQRGFNAPAGWTEFAPRENFTSGRRGMNQAMFYRVATSGDPANYTWTIDTADPDDDHIAVVIAAYRHVDTADPIISWGARSGEDVVDPVAPSITVDGVATGDRIAESGGGSAFEYAAHLVSLRGADSDETRLIGAWSRAHQSTLTPAEPAMVQRGTASDGNGRNGIRATLADEPFVAEGATRLNIDQQPTDTFVNNVISPAITVRIEDSNGNLVVDSDAEVSIAIDSNPSGGALGGTTTVNAVDGVATFDDLFIDQPGEGYTLVAASDDLDPDVSVPFDIVEVVGAFNAFETATPAGSTSGVIKTKVAADTFSIDIVALDDDGTINTNYKKDVTVELLDASDNSGALDANNCRPSWTVIQTLHNDNFGAWADGRGTVTGIVEPEAWRELRIRIRREKGQQETGCSTDAFSIRPAYFSAVEITDSDWESAGSGRSLDTVAGTGGVVHKAGAPFRIEATAFNANDVVTNNYDGSPEATVACLLPAGGNCIDGVVDIGSWQGNGTVETQSALFDEAGSFRTVLEGREFTSVDAGDGSTDDERFTRSGEIDVGRFVPDRFELLVDTEPEFLTFDDAGCTGREFTYIGAPFSYSTRPVTRVRALNVQGQVTANYSHELWKVEPANVTQIYGEDTDPSPVPAHDLDEGLIREPVVASNDDGTGTVTSNDDDELSFIRKAVASGDDPPEPFTADITLTIEVEDTSESGVAGNGVIEEDAPLVYDGSGAGGIGFDESNEFRYGRIRLPNVIGPENRDLTMPVQAQTWREISDGSGVFGWMNEPADSCTALAQSDMTLSENDVGTTISGFTALSDGEGAVTLSAPGAVGTTKVVGELASEFPWLQFDWQGNGDEDPVGRAAFGLFEAHPKRLYQLENL